MTFSLRLKLFLAMTATLLVVAVAILGLVVRTSDQTMHERQRDLEAQIRQNLAEKGKVVAQNHALALRPLVLDNAFGDVKKLVESTVTDDPDILYGVYLAADGTPWAYLSPTHPLTENSATQRPNLDDWKELGLTDPGDARPETRLFGGKVFEFSAPVVADGERVGTVRYGLGDGRLTTALERSRAVAAREKADLVRQVGLTSAALMLLGALVIFRVARQLTLPVKVLERAANAIAAGNRSERVHIHSKDEMEVLADAFNAMLNENERQIVELEDKTEQALAASRMKSEFLANMSHEIRTPMNGVLGMTKLILRRPLDEKVRRYAETVESSANALMTIINDILDFSKMEAGKYTLQSASFEPRTVIQETAELLSSRAAENGVELVYRVSPSLPKRLIGDPDRFRQVLNNLLGNAVKFTREGEIFVDVNHGDMSDGKLVCSVRVKDTGMGIPDAALGTLFDAFTQVDGSRVRQHGGTGLGLTISRRLAHMMGGDITVESKLGVGSTFTATFAFGVDETRSVRPSHDWALGRRVAVVEANPRWSSVIVEHLAAWGLKAVVFEDARAAEAAIHRVAAGKEQFDIVLLGVELGDSQAHAFVTGLRADSRTQALPIIALTRLGASATVSEIEREIVAQIQKPLRLSDLFNALQKTLLGNISDRMPLARMESETVRSLAPILIVDDNEINQIVAAEALEVEGYRTDVASNGLEAFEKVKRNRYLLVLMDCQMPVMDGMQATREIRNWEQGTDKRLPIIALTAHAMAGERERVLGAGMDDYLTKPFHPDSLRRVIERYGLRAAAVEAAAPKPAPAEVDDVVELAPGVRRSPRVVEMFLAHVPSQLVELRTVVEGGNSEVVYQHAHKLKGSCAALRADRMARTAERLQLEAKAGDLTNAADLTADLFDCFEHVAVLLRELTSPTVPPPPPA